MENKKERKEWKNGNREKKSRFQQAQWHSEEKLQTVVANRPWGLLDLMVCCLDILY